MARKSFSTRERVRLFELHGGRCHLCQEKIQVGEIWELEHIVPWSLTRDDSDDNVRPAHKSSHKSKTASDVKAIRKADRVKAKHMGAFKGKAKLGHPFLKKKMDGTVVDTRTGDRV